MRRSLSVIVPTYREARSIPALVQRLAKLRASDDLELELLICDDASDDRTDEVVLALGLAWVRLMTRRGPRDLAQAVLGGLRAARHDTLVVMDADLSHPPESIPAMLEALDAGAEFVLGSRYVQGGAFVRRFTLYRTLNSRVATWLARPLTRAHDPMSGFFALRREFLEACEPVHPTGFKIGLELLVRSESRAIVEIPIVFSDRAVGESKLSLREQLKYLEHLRRLIGWRLRRARTRRRGRSPDPKRRLGN